MNWNVFCKCPLADSKLTFNDSVSLINTEHWNRVVDRRNIYLSLDYLSALEKSMEGIMEFRYILFYNKDLQPIGVASVQLLNFADDGSKYQELLSKAGINIKYKLPESFDMKVMICGNIFSCGENGFAFVNGISEEEGYETLSNGLNRLKYSEKGNGEVSLILLKEFWPRSFEKSRVLKTFNFSDFMIDVNMVLKINESWKIFDDYLASMTTKFRTKAKSVFKRSEEVRSVDFSKEDIAKFKNEIEALYTSVIEKADFNIGTLNGDAFFNFKKNLGNDFIFKGYFLKDKLIGFNTAFVFNNIVDANYVGIDYDFNQEYALYQRMLYDFVDLAITRKSSELRLGRTAEEIKSCIGAEPVDMKLYVKHGSKISNRLLKPIIESITPSEFEFRHPFKANQAVIA